MTIFRRVGLTALTALGLLILASTVSAQESFRVTYEVDTSNPGRTRVTGVVFNDARTDVFDVHVTAEALNSAGKVVGRGIAFVSAQIRQGGNAPFEALVPAKDADKYRVRVTNFRLGMTNQAP
jgi:hypothetical protein